PLHLDDELFPVISGTGKVEYGTTLIYRFAGMLVFVVYQIRDVFPSAEHTIEEVNQQILVGFAPKEPFETEVGQRVYVLLYGRFFCFCHGQIYCFSQTLLNQWLPLPITSRPAASVRPPYRCQSACPAAWHSAGWS